MTAIRNITKTRLLEISEKYGNESISSSKVKEELGNDYYVALIKYGYFVRRGVYHIDAALTEESPEQCVNIVSENTVSKSIIKDSVTYENRVTEFIKNETLIPEVNTNYVPFGCFKAVESVVRSKSFLPMYITGLSGNGKTLSVQQACAKHNRELIHINITNGTIEDDLLGCFVLEDGNMIWKDGPVLIAMRRGAVLLLDEIDNIGTEAMCLQEVLQNKPVYIKKTNEIVYPKSGFNIIGTANTKGSGEGIDKFVGANVLNDAFLERFNVVFEQEYPEPDIEAKILDKVCQDKRFMVNIIRWANETRTAYNNGSISGCITTRRLVQICQNLNVFGDKITSIQYAINRFLKEDVEGMMDLYKQIAGSSDTNHKDGLSKYYAIQVDGNVVQTTSNNNLKAALTLANRV